MLQGGKMKNTKYCRSSNPGWTNLTYRFRKKKTSTFDQSKVQKRSPIYKLENSTIKTVYNFRYLYVVLDRNLNFVQYLKKKHLKTETVAEHLLKFSSFESHLSCFILTTWYKTIIERKLTYATPVWLLRLQPSDEQRLLNSIQTNNLLLIATAYKKAVEI